MKARIASVVPLCLLFAGITMSVGPAATAQDQSSNVHGPSNYLFLTNVSLKPGTFDQFMAHESAEVQAKHEANVPEHYFGMVSITGTSRLLFFSGYDSFADMQKNHQAVMSNSQLMNTIRTNDAAEAPLVTAASGSVYQYRKDLSLNAPVDISQMRIFEITLFRIRSGHHQDWERLVKLYMKAFENVPDARWATFEKMYGVGSDNVFIVVSPMKSMTDVDAEVADDKKLPSTVGEAQMQTMRQLGSATIESSESDLFAVSPQISYVPDAWISSSPDFWGKK